MNVKEISLAVRRFRMMVGTEYSGQEKDKLFVESALLWHKNFDEIQKHDRACSCDEGTELRDFRLSDDKKSIIFIYRCDFCYEYSVFKYKRVNKSNSLIDEILSEEILTYLSSGGATRLGNFMFFIASILLVVIPILLILSIIFGGN